MDAPEPVLVPVLPRGAPRRRRPVVALALALLVVAVAAYLAFQLSRSELPQPPLPGVPARLAVVDTEGRLVTMDATGGAREIWDVPGVSFQFPAWSPDGSRIAFSSTRDGNTEIYSMNPDGSDQVNLTSNPAGDDDPAWSPAS